MKRLFLPSLLLATAGLGAAAPWLSEFGRADAPAYRTAALDRGDIVATVATSGTLNAVVLVDVSSQISGQLQELYADFNSAVTQGEVIARIAPETYEAKVKQAEAELEIAQALLPVQHAQIERNRADLENAQAALAGARAQTVRAEVALDDASRDWERKRPLAERGVVSENEGARAKNAYHSAVAQVNATRADEQSQSAAARAATAVLRMAEAQLPNNLAQVKQREAVLQQARTDLERTYIRAPVTGTVVNRAVNRGQTVAASLSAPTLFTLAKDLTRMQVQASVVEADVGRFQVGQAATFTVDAFPGLTFTGEVTQIRKAPLVVQNVVTYTVVISAENPDQGLLPGMTANLRVVVARKNGVLKVPNTALRFRPVGVPPGEAQLSGGADPASGRPGGSLGMPGRVFVVGPDGRPTPVSLWLGATDGRMTEVLAGELAEGQAVITGTAPAGLVERGPRLAVAGRRLL
jgi:HlyD family secretion protein